MKHLRESILTSIGQGDKYFDELYKKYGLNPKKVTWNKDGSIDYGGIVDLSRNNFTKLPFKFNKVQGTFSCSDCKNLLSLEGCPKEVNGIFDCNNCKSLTSLEGSPEKLKGDFYCIRCIKITSLKGCPKEVGNDFICYDCGRNFTEEEVRKYCDVKKDIYV